MTDDRDLRTSPADRPAPPPPNRELSTADVAVAADRSAGGSTTDLERKIGDREVERARAGAPADMNAAPDTPLLATDVVSALAFSSDFALAYACSGGAVYTSGNPMDTNALWSIASVPPTTGVAFNCAGITPIPFLQGGVPQVALATDQGAFVSLDGTSFLGTNSLGSTSAANSFAISFAA